MASVLSEQLLQMETTCGTLLCELKIIWDEVGESDEERDKLLFELEQECLEVYRRKVDQANQSRAQFLQAIADSEAELAAICSAMGERPVHPGQHTMSLKEELRAIVPQLEEMRRKKSDRRNRFLEVIEQMQHLSNEIRPTECNPSKNALDESDLSNKRLEELQRQLELLQKEKSDRLKKVQEHLNTLKCLCLVLGLDFKQTVTEVHPSFDGAEGSRSINNRTIEGLISTVHRLREVKLQRMQKLQDFATAMLELWNLMDTPIEEQQLFQNVACNIAASEHEITEPNMLSEDFMNHVETEVLRLEQLKGSKMKELVLKKTTELEGLRRQTHLIAAADNEIEFAVEAIETGAVDSSLVLDQIERQISVVKEEAFSRKPVLEKVEKWLAACEEESWLDEYNRDENRYSAGRGAHLTLKRAEKARSVVNKIPATVEALRTKVTAWEKDRGIDFTYDGVRVMTILEEYNILRQEKEHERKRQRDQKKLEGQLMVEQEMLYGSKSSPLKPQNVKKVPRTFTGAPNRRLSLGGGALRPPKHDSIHSTKSTCSTTKAYEGAELSAGMPVKQISSHASNFHENVSPRKPFATLLPVNGMESTPSNPIPTVEEDKDTPGAIAMPVPRTPMFISVPMQMANTPAPACFAFAAAATGKEEEIEYSFEERKLAFLFQRTVEI